MNKQIFIIIFSLIIGIGIGIMLTVIAYPFVFPPPEVNEQISNIKNKQLTHSGIFIQPNPSDPVHWGKGKVAVYEHGNDHEIFLDEDFEVGPGPAYHVYLSSAADVISNEQFENATNYDLGKLKSFRSSQVYQAPSNFESTQIKSVVIWCKTFSQLITSATLDNK